MCIRDRAHTVKSIYIRTDRDIRLPGAHAGHASLAVHLGDAGVRALPDNTGRRELFFKIFRSIVRLRRDAQPDGLPDLDRAFCRNTRGDTAGCKAERHADGN